MDEEYSPLCRHCPPQAANRVYWENVRKETDRISQEVRSIRERLDDLTRPKPERNSVWPVVIGFVLGVYAATVAALLVILAVKGG